MTLTIRSGTIVGAFLLAPVAAAVVHAQILVDHSCTNIRRVPGNWIDEAAATLHIAYNHTSHGSHLISGMNALEQYPPFADTFVWSDDGVEGLDLDDNGIPCSISDLSQGDSIDENGVTPWVTCTRDFLNDEANSHINVIMWSWCSISRHDAQRYLDNMEILIQEYPAVQFVFMTGHAEGQGEDMRTHFVHYNNELIRKHCRVHDRVLFDFADVEAYDPDGTYFWHLNMLDNLSYDGGNWAQDWIAENPLTELAQLVTGEGVQGYDGLNACAHSDSPPEATLNCILKGRAAWWLFARLAGWQPGSCPAPRRPTRRIIPLGLRSVRQSVGLE